MLTALGEMLHSDLNNCDRLRAAVSELNNPSQVTQESTTRTKPASELLPRVVPMNFVYTQERQII